jgi:hypothetical protein
MRARVASSKTLKIEGMEENIEGEVNFMVV